MAAQKKDNTASSSSKERRLSQRSPIELAASFGMGEDPRPEREGRISNISDGGFCFISRNKLKVGDEVQLAVDLDVREQAIISVEVVWVQKAEDAKSYRIGVRLLESEGPDFERFMEFYRKQG